MGKENETVNVVVSGCEGRMGQLIVKLVNQHPGWRVVIGIDQSDKNGEDFHVIGNTFANWDAINPSLFIDFSSPEGTHQIYRLAKELGVPLVTGTTKLTGGIIGNMKEQKRIPVFQAFNMSSSVHKFIQNVCTEAKERAEQGYDIDIIEAHHTGKADAPSGTAEILYEAINKALGGDYERVLGCPNRVRKPKEIRITSLRLGSIPGTHEVLFSKAGEKTIELKHEASDRSEFAEGAITAAEFLLKQEPGYYDMSSIYGKYTD